MPQWFATAIALGRRLAKTFAAAAALVFVSATAALADVTPRVASIGTDASTSGWQL